MRPRAWELEIKAARRKLVLPDNWLAAANETGFLHMPVTAAEGQASARLSRHHTDPFDRVLIAQALQHGLRVATRDAIFSACGVPVLEA